MFPIRKLKLPLGLLLCEFSKISKLKKSLSDVTRLHFLKAISSFRFMRVSVRINGLYKDEHLDTYSTLNRMVAESELWNWAQTSKIPEYLFHLLFIKHKTTRQVVIPPSSPVADDDKWFMYVKNRNRSIKHRKILTKQIPTSFFKLAFVPHLKHSGRHISFSRLKNGQPKYVGVFVWGYHILYDFVSAGYL